MMRANRLDELAVSAPALRFFASAKEILDTRRELQLSTKYAKSGLSGLEQLQDCSMSNAKAARVVLNEIRQVISDMQFSYSCSSVPHRRVSADVLRGERSFSIRGATEAITNILNLPVRDLEAPAWNSSEQKSSRRGKTENILAEIRQVIVDMQFCYTREIPAGETVSGYVLHGDSLVSRSDAIKMIEAKLDRSPRDISPS